MIVTAYFGDHDKTAAAHRRNGTEIVKGSDGEELRQSGLIILGGGLDSAEAARGADSRGSLVVRGGDRITIWK